VQLLTAAGPPDATRSPKPSASAAGGPAAAVLFHHNFNKKVVSEGGRGGEASSAAANASPSIHMPKSPVANAGKPSTSAAGGPAAAAPFHHNFNKKVVSESGRGSKALSASAPAPSSPAKSSKSFLPASPGVSVSPAPFRTSPYRR